MHDKTYAGVAVFLVGGLYGAWTVGVEQATERSSSQSAAAAPDRSVKASRRVSVAVARDRAMAMHDVYIATLEAMHRHYFHENRAVLPARALEEVFAEQTERSGTHARWISVNTPAMSLSHEPKDDFEKQAAQAIASGKAVFERIQNGVLQRAGPVSLDGGCASCHLGHFAKPSSKPLYAGLVIRIRVTDEPSEP
jgi:hypothetical protein